MSNRGNVQRKPNSLSSLIQSVTEKEKLTAEQFANRMIETGYPVSDQTLTSNIPKWKSGAVKQPQGASNLIALRLALRAHPDPLPGRLKDIVWRGRSIRDWKRQYAPVKEHCELWLKLFPEFEAEPTQDDIQIGLLLEELDAPVFQAVEPGYRRETKLDPIQFGRILRLVQEIEAKERSKVPIERTETSQRLSEYAHDSDIAEYIFTDLAELMASEDLNEGQSYNLASLGLSFAMGGIRIPQSKDVSNGFSESAASEVEKLKIIFHHYRAAGSFIEGFTKESVHWRVDDLCGFLAEPGSVGITAALALSDMLLATDLALISYQLTDPQSALVQAAFNDTEPSTHRMILLLRILGKHYFQKDQPEGKIVKLFLLAEQLCDGLREHGRVAPNDLARIDSNLLKDKTLQKIWSIFTLSSSDWHRFNAAICFCRMGYWQDEFFEILLPNRAPTLHNFEEFLTFCLSGAQSETIDYLLDTVASLSNPDERKAGQLVPVICAFGTHQQVKTLLKAARTDRYVQECGVRALCGGEHGKRDFRRVFVFPWWNSEEAFRAAFSFLLESWSVFEPEPSHWLNRPKEL